MKVLVTSRHTFTRAWHGSWNDATYSDGSFGMDRWLVNVKQNASRARRLAALEKKVGISWQPEQFWKTGEWLDQLTGPYRKESPWQDDLRSLSRSRLVRHTSCTC